jgi:hypothetical protein
MSQQRDEPTSDTPRRTTTAGSKLVVGGALLVGGCVLTVSLVGTPVVVC